MEDQTDTTIEEAQDIETLKAQIAQMEAEAAAMDEGKAPEGDKKEGGGEKEGGDAARTDNNSIYVGQVEYSCTPEDLVSHFSVCGDIERVTIQCDPYSGNPKGEQRSEPRSEAPNRFERFQN
ncbi:hypothetical protein TL16_g04798 [Triparma laevis f. inornata]|uniref:RRM domain-containing protein n=1 Tax=Triparma laevis f. inornata TaxID=1714386 RepID=A0A9W7AC29_9STRA|nr:hypothetical protein TL16_g04798 [Triparma laevis f. inornata]